MKALRYECSRLAVTNVARPESADEALVQVTLAGICNTDLEIARGYAGFEGTLGHEFVGVVERAPNYCAELVGKRVVGEINVGCGQCELCLSGDARHCPARTVLGIVKRDGAMAEFVQLPVGNLLVVPDSVSDQQAVFTEPLAAACGIIERTLISSETTVAVIGDGKLGLLCAQALRQSTARITLIGKHHNKLQIAARRDIEIHLLNDLARHAAEKFDVVVEASGAAAGFELALDLVRPRGVLILKSTFHGQTPLDAARIVVNEISVVGSRCGRFALALELLERKAVDVESLISESFSLARGVEAMQQAGASGVLKILLKP